MTGPRSSVPAALCGLLLAASVIAAQAPAALDQPFAPQVLPRIEPGTRLGDGAAAGWTYLVFKSRSRVTAGDVENIAPIAVELTKKYATIVTVTLEPAPDSHDGPYRLKQAAVGLGIRVGQTDEIVSKATATKSSVPLGFLDQRALAESEARLEKVILVARSPTMAIVDYPGCILRGEKHVEIILRHAYLVDPRNGRVTGLIWIVDKTPDGYRPAADGPMVRLVPHAALNQELHVDSNKFFLGLPGPDAFAQMQPPAGTPLNLSDDVRTAACVTTFSPNSLYRLETALWQALFAADK